MKKSVLFVAAALCLVVACSAQSSGFDGESDPAAARSRHPEIQPQERVPTFYPELFEGGATPREKAEVDWLNENKWIDAGIARNKFFGTAGGGMVYTKDVKHGEEIFALPIEVMVYTSNPHISPTTKQILEIFREKFRGPGLVAEDFELTEMGLIVMFERRDPKSFWSHYLNTVQDPLCPAFFQRARTQRV